MIDKHEVNGDSLPEIDYPRNGAHPNLLNVDHRTKYVRKLRQNGFSFTHEDKYFGRGETGYVDAMRLVGEIEAYLDIYDKLEEAIKCDMMEVHHTEDWYRHALPDITAWHQSSLEGVMYVIGKRIINAKNQLERYNVSIVTNGDTDE